ncbi:MAG: glutamyl-tRNA reductase [Solirubrobacteraceae bacterium]|nr:glutamyl-tRNA reductase [Solirubrobacteraceae bacterium]
MSELLALGISHRTAPVAMRERLALTERAADQLVHELVERGEAREAVAISTCNRTEVYLVVADAARAESEMLTLLAARGEIPAAELVDVVYAPRNCDAARHLFRVTGGLDSMIVGESEVQGQVRRAYEAALAGGTTGPFTNRLFRAALQAGKRVRTETAVGEARVSVSTVAVAAAAEAVGDLAGRQIVIVGAGETAELAARAFADQGVEAMFIANRRAERAHALAARYGGTVEPLDRLPERLVAADVVVAATSSPHTLVGAAELRLVMEARGGRPLVLIDVAVPRDVEPQCAALDGVRLLDMDDLQAVVSRNIEVRESERERAEAIVEAEIDRFSSWLGQQGATPTIAALRSHGATIVEQVLEENAGRWESASQRDLARIEAVARAVAQRLLHEPTIRMRGLEHGGGHGRLEVLRELFGLDEAVDAAERPSAGAPAEVRELRRRSAPS